MIFSLSLINGMSIGIEFIFDKQEQEHIMILDLLIIRLIVVKGN
jgi:hypothetical protein